MTKTEKELVIEQIDLNKSLVQNCPRWKFCDSNSCSLEDHNYKSFPHDPNSKCMLGKTRRKRLLREYPQKLKYAEKQRENRQTTLKTAIGGNR